jgi:hypothetical protein
MGWDNQLYVGGRWGAPDGSEINFDSSCSRHCSSGGSGCQGACLDDQRPEHQLAVDYMDVLS